MVANLNTVVIYCGSLTLEKVELNNRGKLLQYFYNIWPWAKSYKENDVIYWVS